MKIHPSYQLRPHNTFAVDCQTSYYIEIECKEDAQLLHQDEFFRSLPFLLMGGGSNLLFIGDFRGATLHYSGQSIEVIHEDTDTLIWRVEAGVNWHDLVLKSVEQQLWGIENLALIPGEVGAAAVQNIGAYGAEVSQVIAAVHTIDILSGEEVTWLPEEIHYDYRYSIFKDAEMRHLMVYAVDIRLSKTPMPNLKYAGLQELADTPHLTPQIIAQRVIEIRESKLPKPEELPNAGSFFMNPIVDGHTFLNLLDKYPQMPHYVISEQAFKIPAAWLIDQAGFKGVREGEVGTYPKQPLVIVNYGTTIGRDIATFSEKIQSAVHQQFGIDLHPEVRFIISAEQYSINQLDN